MNPVVHFEMPYEDRDRAEKFYSSAFGWKTEKLGSEMGNYMVMQTAEMDDKRMIKEPGRINGGMYEKPKGEASVPSFVIAVDDISAATKKIEEAGGTMVNEPMEVPGIGMYASFKDTEGNKLSILKPLANM